MTTITRKIWVDAPKDKVWAALADFGGVYKFNPNVPTSFSTSDENEGVGATRHCDLAIPGASLEERIINWKEGESYTIEIYEGKMQPPMKFAYGTLGVEEEAGGTIVTGTMEYEMKYGVLGFLMNQMMLKSQLIKAWERVFAGLKYYVETGEEVDKSVRVNVSAVVSVA